MKEWLLIFLAACCIPFQANINSRLGMLLRNPFLAALCSFVGGAIALSLVCVVHSQGLPRIPSGVKIPWYLLTGGLLGSLFVTAVLTYVPRIGTTNMITAAVVGQLVTGLILDHFGLLGIPEHRASLMRVEGVLLLIVGTFMIQWG